MVAVRRPSRAAAATRPVPFPVLMLGLALLLGACAGPGERTAASAAPLLSDSDLGREIAAEYERDLGALFEHFHRHPELSFLEHATAARLAAELEDAGAEVTTGVGGTGLVGVLRNGEGPTVLVRADMDGLPVKEDSGLAYASTATQVDRDGRELPVMHACGHDVHMTALVGTARLLARHRERWSGTVLLVGQPAEERIGGARAMLADGLYQRFGVPDAALALHVAAEAPAGTVSLRSGLVYSSSDSVDVIVPGVGAHGAAPHKGVDPIVLGSQIVLALQTLVSREIAPLQPGVVTVGSFHAGFKHNIIPDEARLQLTVRSDDEAVRATLLAGIERIAENLGRAAGLPEDDLPRVEFVGESTPTTVNDPALTARVRAAFERALGPERLHASPREGMGAEDFAEFVQTPERVPGVYFSVGGTPPAALAAERDGGPPVPSHHSPFFRIAPRPAVSLGIEAMTVAVLELLGTD